MSNKQKRFAKQQAEQSALTAETQAQQPVEQQPVEQPSMAEQVASIPEETRAEIVETPAETPVEAPVAEQQPAAPSDEQIAAADAAAKALAEQKEWEAKLAAMSPDQIAQLFASQQARIEADKTAKIQAAEATFKAAQERVLELEKELGAARKTMADAVTVLKNLRGSVPKAIGMPTSVGGFRSGVMLEIDGIRYNSPTAAAKFVTGSGSEINGNKWWGLTGTEVEGQVIERRYTPKGGVEQTFVAIVRKVDSNRAAS